MGYKGETRVVSCSQGGLTGAKNIDAIPNYMMISPSRNLLLEQRGRRKRGGTAHVYDSAFSGTPRILGVYDCTFRDGTQYILSATDDGDIYRDDTNKIATGLGTVYPYSFAFGENKLFVADGVNEPQVWPGTGSAATVATPAADWSTNPPFQIMKHGRGVSERMCAINRTTLYLSKSYSTDGDMEEFVTGAEAIYIDTGDGHGLVGMTEIGQEIVLFGKKKPYRFDDSDVDSSNWGYSSAQWEGGAAHWRLIIKTPEDVVIMTDDGIIYSVRAAQEYGDYKSASLTKDSWMHDWIMENVRLDYVDHFHGCYSPMMRAVLIWVVKNGKTTVDTALVYFIDRDSSEAWMIHDNDSAASGYQASASCIVKDLASNKSEIYIGDYSGNLWKLNTANRNDEGNGYYSGFKTPNESMDNPRNNKHFNSLRAILEPKGNFNLQVKTWVDGRFRKTDSINMSGAGIVLGTFILGTDFLAGDELIDAPSPLGYRGKRIQYEFYNAGVDEDFFISSYMTDYKLAGATRE